MVGMFVGLHVALAVRTNTPELAVEPDEAKAFMRAAQNVMRHYDVRATQKTLDWISFVGCAGSIYGTRAFAIMARRAQERQEAQERGSVIPWPIKPRSRPGDDAAAPEPPPGYAPPSVPQEFDGAPIDTFGGFEG